VKPTIYPFEQHRIAVSDIDPQACYVIEKLRAAGFAAYLVGGGVRDLLLKHRPKDFDISTSAQPEEIREIFRNSILIGRRFRLAHVRFGKKIIEVATFRSGDNASTDLIVRDNVWGTEEEDVLRRDFTINGLLYDLEHQTIIDYVDGFSDIEKRVLRTIGAPEIRFVQDPVRMLRLVKFCARFDLQIDPKTHEALLACREEITKSSQARILEELLRMLESGAAQRFFHLLHEYDLLRSLLAPLASLFPHTPLFLELLGEMDAEVKKSQETPDRALLLSALLFPFCHHSLRTLLQQRNNGMHLGEIIQETADLVDDAFAPFFQLPRRMHHAVTSILAAQYRILSLDEQPPRRPRPPRDPYFALALHLFKLRATVHPELWPHYQLWTEASFAASHPQTHQRPKGRRRSR
jgi:poly(A) polymerase